MPGVPPFCLAIMRGGAIPPISDGTRIPGNENPSETERCSRIDTIHAPYHAAIADLIDRRVQAGLRTILVALHSFTPALQAVERPWHVGVLHRAGRDEFALKVLTALRETTTLDIGDNQPYAFDRTDYTVPRHAFPRDLPWVDLEIRQDLLLTREQVDQVADWLAPILAEALTGI